MHGLKDRAHRTKDDDDGMEPLSFNVDFACVTCPQPLARRNTCRKLLHPSGLLDVCVAFISSADEANSNGIVWRHIRDVEALTCPSQHPDLDLAS